MVFSLLDKRPGRMVPLVLLLLGALPLAGAYISQYGFGYAPCSLCLYQRIPYWIIVGIACLSIILNLQRESLSRLIAIAALSFLVDAGIAAFHTGVEQHWWVGLEGCKDEGVVVNTIEELRAKITQQSIARCDEPALLIFGLSMAVWNLLYAFGCTLFSCMLLGRYARG